MAELKDSGARRDFGTGAVRDAADGKGRCDLLPLDIIADNMRDQVLQYIALYISEGATDSLWWAVDFFAKQYMGTEPMSGNIYTAMLEVAHQFEDGARKYGDNNWRKGIPLHCYIDSAIRHYLKFCRGDTDEPHDRAVCWNLLCAIWTHENKPELIDLPFGEIAKGEKV